jgi:hypothetical protein
VPKFPEHEFWDILHRSGLAEATLMRQPTRVLFFDAGPLVTLHVNCLEVKRPGSWLWGATNWGAMDGLKQLTTQTLASAELVRDLGPITARRADWTWTGGPRVEQDRPVEPVYWRGAPPPHDFIIATSSYRSDSLRGF